MPIFNVVGGGTSESGPGNYQASAVDLTVVAQTSIVTVPADKRLIIERVDVIIDPTVVGVGFMPKIQFGINGDTDSMLAPVLLSPDMINPNKIERWMASELLDAVIPAGESIEFGVTEASGVATHTATVVVYGFLV